jgi:predicted RNA binding protein YcfA (HicA-like mRNA interferase family)
MKIRDVLRLIETDGWYLIGQEGSHRQYKHPLKKGRVTGDDLHPKTLTSLLRQAGLKGEK